jgi:hypothetical protein
VGAVEDRDRPDTMDPHIVAVDHHGGAFIDAEHSQVVEPALAPGDPAVEPGTRDQAVEVRHDDVTLERPETRDDPQRPGWPQAETPRAQGHRRSRRSRQPRSITPAIHHDLPGGPRGQGPHQPVRNPAGQHDQVRRRQRGDCRDASERAGVEHVDRCPERVPPGAGQCGGRRQHRR